MKYDTQRPYAAAFVIAQNEKGEIAFVLRSNTKWMNGFYGLPSGKVEIGESFSAAAIREAKEEINIDVELENLKPVLTVHRASTQQDKSKMEWIDQYFTAEKWSGEAHNAEPDMHSELAWLDPRALPENTIPEVAAAIKVWLEGDDYLEYGW